MAETAVQRARAELERRRLADAAKAELARRQQVAPAPQDPMLPSPDTDTRSTQEYRSDMGLDEPLVDTSMIGQPTQPRQFDGAADVGASALSAIPRVASGMLSLPAMAGEMLDRGYEKLGLIPEGSAAIERERSPLSSANIQNAVSARTGGGSNYDPSTTAGEFAQTTADFATGAKMANAPMMMAGVIPGIGSELAGQATEGTPYEPIARIAGALAAPAAISRAQKVISPTSGRLDPARMRAVEALRAEGVNPTAGQVAGPTVGQNQLYREAATATGRQAADDAAEGFTRAAMRTIGEGDAIATPDVLEAATKRIGSVFDDAIQGVDIVPSGQNVTQLQNVISQADDLTSSGLPRLFEKIGGAVDDAVSTGQPIRADVARNWRSNLSALTKNQDSGVRSAAIDALDVVDDIIENSLNAAGRPQAVQQLATARQQYRNLLAIERAAIRADGGVLTPPQLRTALLGQSRRQYTQNKGDLTPLTRNANEVLETLPQSGTTPRSLAQQLTGNAPAGSAAGLGGLGLGVDPLAATAVGAAATAAPAIRNQVMSSPIGQQYFLNQLAGRADVTPKMLAGLLAGTTAQQQGQR